MLLSKDYKRCYSTNVGHYAGFKVTIAIEQRTSKPLAILMHEGCPNDSKVFDDMLFELQKRRILRIGQLILADRGFYSLNNYLIGLNKYKIIPLTFNIPKEKTLFNHINNEITRPFRCFQRWKISKRNLSLSTREIN